MLTLPRLLLELDPTASASANYIALEEHTTTILDERAIRLNFGAFFSKDFKLFAVNGNDENIELTYGTHYRFIEFYPRTAEDCGQEVWGAVLTLDPDLGPKFRATYRAYGGETQGHLKAFAEAVKKVPAAGAPVAYRDILLRPKGLPPKRHLHDVLDLYGLSFLRDGMSGIITAVENAPDGRRLRVLEYHRVSRIQSQIDVGNFEADLRAHIRNKNNPHGDTAASVGFGDLVNMGFNELKNGFGEVIAEGYASPSRVRSVINNQIGQRLRKHAHQKGNVHNDTAFTIGLGNLINAPVHTGYSSDDVTLGGLMSTYLEPLQEVYVGPYSVTSFVQEYTLQYRSGGIGGSIGNFLDATEAQLGQIAQFMTQFNLNYIALTPKLQAISQSVGTVDARLGQFVPEEIEYRMLNVNSCYAQFLKQVVDHRPTTVYNTPETSIDVPKLVRGLDLWLDFGEKEFTVTDPKANNTEVRKLHAVIDRNNTGRVFAQSNAAARPDWDKSADTANPTVPGLLLRKVAKFTSGSQFFAQSQGPAVQLKTTSTLFILARTGADGTTLWPLMKKPSNTSLTASEGILLHGDQRRLIKVATDNNRFSVNTPVDSSQSTKCTLIVLSLHAQELSHCWAAGRIAMDQGVYPRNLSAIPVLNEHLTLDQIGINKGSFLQSGELAEILLYQERLSLREVQAVAYYLQKKHGGQYGLPLAVDFVQTTFEAA